MPASFQTWACAHHPPSSPSRVDSPFSGGDVQLLDWLTTYTFPAESKFKDLDYAERIYTDVVQRVIASGVSDRAIAPSSALIVLRRRPVATTVAWTVTRPCVSRTSSVRKVITTLNVSHHIDHVSRPAGFRRRRFAVVRSPFRLLTYPTEMQHELALSRLLHREFCPRVH